LGYELDMSQENLELIRRSNALANAGRWDAAMELLAPDVEWVVAKEHPEARTLVGHDAVSGYRRAWQDTLPDLQIEVERLLGRGEKVAAIGVVRGTGSGSGAGLRVPLGIVYTVRDGLIVRAEEFLDPDEALAAVGEGE
jgi:ketosteroid isomerase-like protein